MICDGLYGSRKTILLVGMFAGSLVVAPALAQTGQGQNSEQASAPGHPALDWRARDGLYYKRNWGVDIIGVHPIASGYMLEFRYSILDPDKAKTLNDGKAKAYLIDEATGTRLAVPNMENIGELRQKATPHGYRTYFIIFGNPGKLVKPGGRVTVVVGDFRADGLVVD